MREVYKNSAKASILLYLYHYGDTQKSNLINALSGNNERYVQRVTNELVENGMVEVYKKPPKPKWKPVRFVHLTDKGRAAAKALTAEENEFVANQDLQTIKKAERKVLVLQVYDICKSMGCLVDDSQRVPLERLIGLQADEVTGEEKEILKNMQESGAYYSMTEIRVTCRKVLGNGPLNATRCIGILIRQHEILFLYNMGSKLIFFNKVLEQRTKEFVLESMERSCVARELINFNLKKSAKCILFGNSYVAIAKLFFKRKGGALNVDENGEIKKNTGKWEPNKDRISIETLSEIYSAAYFVSISSARRDFANVLETTSDRTRKVVAAWIQKQNNIRAIEDASGAQAIVKMSNDYVYCWFDNDLFGLYRLCKSGVSAHVIIPIEGPEQAVARVMGTRLVSVRTVSGKICKVTPYDDTGHPIKEKKENQ